MIDTGILITGSVGMLTTIVSGWASWFFARKKYNAEVDNATILNMKEALDFYKKLSDDNRQRLEEVLRRNEQLLAEVTQLREHVFEVMTNICYNFSCKSRLKEPAKTKKKDGIKVGEEMG